MFKQCHNDQRTIFQTFSNKLFVYIVKCHHTILSFLTFTSCNVLFLINKNLLSQFLGPKSSNVKITLLILITT